MQVQLSFSVSICREYLFLSLHFQSLCVLTSEVSILWAAYQWVFLKSRQPVSLLIGSFQTTYVWVRWFCLPLDWVYSCSPLHFLKISFLVSFSSRISMQFFYFIIPISDEVPILSMYCFPDYVVYLWLSWNKFESAFIYT